MDNILARRSHHVQFPRDDGLISAVGAAPGTRFGLGVGVGVPLSGKMSHIEFVDDSVVNLFLTCLAVCNTVVPSGSDGTELSYAGAYRL